MGVTIHFEGSLHDQARFAQVVGAAKSLAECEGWGWEAIEEKVVTLKRVLNEQARDYTGPTRGIVLYPHENSEPLRLEFDGDLFVQEFIKTQFAPVQIHVQIVRFLKDIAPHFKAFTVCDEGEYWETEAVEVLENHRRTISQLLREQLAARPDLVGPVALPTGRIADLMTQS
jgi:hypothetical protein